MELEEKLLFLMNAANGIMSFSELIEHGFTKRQIKKMESNQWIERVSKGIYIHKNYLCDTLKIYQLDSSSFIYSNETAAYLHGLSDRYPRIYSVTTYSGCHLRKSDEFKIFYVKKERLDLGVIEIKDNAGNYVKVYDKERTICDLIKNKDRIELQIYSETIQNYFKEKVKLNMISKYAKQLGISKEVADVVSLMMRE
ncbi:MAG: hypothetical protein RR524_03980 [Erysipelotrichaceae bacterium]